MLRLVVVALLFAAAEILSLGRNGSNPAGQFDLTIAANKVKVELASSAAERATGLMFREQLAVNSGMLFVFSADQLLSFYMKNTTIPLSIAYIDRDLIIREIYQMEPLSLQVVSSKWPARYALEMAQGWFAEHRVKVGDRLIPSVELRQKILETVGAAAANQ